jgi:ubiquinol-cytochrome c reductase iron-sulfur subunit
MTESDQQGSEPVDVDDRQTGHDPADPERTGDRRRAERRAGIALALATVAGIGLFVVYFAGGQTQVEGLLFAIALGSFGIALGIWANHLLDAREVVEERHELSSGPAGRQAFEAAFTEEIGPVLARRSLLLKLLAGAGGALGLALLLPVLSLGPAPGNTLKVTPWRAGSRVVDEEGEPVSLNQVPEDGFLTVFPEGHEGAADAQTLLIHVRPGSLKLPPERLAGVPEGTHVAYSKMHPRRLPGGAVPGREPVAHLPLPPVAVRRVRRGHAVLRAGRPAPAPAAAGGRRGGRAGRPG